MHSDLEDYESSMIKSESSTSGFNWDVIPKVIDLTDSDDHNPPASIKSEDPASPFDWSKLPELIELSSDDESGLQPAINSADSVVHNATRTTILGRKLQRRAKANGPEAITKMQEMQKKLAEKFRGNSFATGHSGLFNKSNDQGSSQHGPLDQNSNYDSDSDVQATVTFQKVKKAYNAKRQSKSNTFEDDVMWAKAQSAELARIERLKNELDLLGQDEKDESEEELFIPQGEPLASQRRYPSMLVDGVYAEQIQGHIVSDDEVDVIQDQEFENGCTQEKLPNKRVEQNEIRKDREASMRAGIEEFLQHHKQTDTKKSGTRKRKSRGKSSKEKSQKSKRPKPTRAGYLMNSDSLMSSNVFEDASKNLDRPQAQEPSIWETRKQDALKRLLVNVPLEDLRYARSEKTHLLKSTKVLGPNGRCGPDGEGNWKLKGMKTSLYHYQVQGAAWMKERETGNEKPLGGILADQMGLGKTVMLIACMIANPPAQNATRRTTLIVCTASLAIQWEQELTRHTKPHVFPHIIRHQSGSKSKGPGAIFTLEKADIVITTYDEVRRSYPKFAPPKHLSPDEIRAWWTAHFDKHCDLLHQVYWYRIVLDEAQAIKNRDSHTSIACRALIGKCRWAISATPIQNRVEELYPFFRLLQVKHTGSFETFKENFCGQDQDSTMRLHAFLRQFMIRRTHADSLFGRPLLVLPKTSQRTIEIEFNKVERALYDAVCHRFSQKIKRIQHDGLMEKSYRNILHMLLRLRQLTAHPFMLQSTIEDILEGEDIEKLMILTIPEGNEEQEDLLAAMKKMIKEKTNPFIHDVASDTTPSEDQIIDDEEIPTGTDPLIFKFRKYLRSLARSDKWEDIKKRTICRRCEDCPEEPYVTNCFHIYCHDCLVAMQTEAAQENENGAKCLECDQRWRECRPCTGIQELELDPANPLPPPVPGPGDRCSSRKAKDEDMKWINYGGRVLPSSKTAAVQAQIEEWFRTAPDEKVIVFSQFYTM